MDKNLAFDARAGELFLRYAALAAGRGYIHNLMAEQIAALKGTKARYRAAEVSDGG